MAKMKCGVAAVEALRAAGVSKVFGLMGSSTLEIYDALYDAKDMLYIGAHVLSPRFDEVMKLCGGNGYFVTDAGGTADAVNQAMKAGKPAVIHVKVDPEAVLSFRTDSLVKRS